MKVLITSGGCKVPIDDVRFLGNFSSGRYGKELADEFYNRGHEVYFFHEYKSERPEIIDERMHQCSYRYYDGYLGVKEIISDWQPDVIISAAAISDYIVDKVEGKISSNEDELVIRLKKGEKVIKSFRELAPNALIVGFKLLVNPTSREKVVAIDKVSKYADIVIYNDLVDLRNGKPIRYIYGPKTVSEDGFMVKQDITLSIDTKRTVDTIVGYIEDRLLDKTFGK